MTIISSSECKPRQACDGREYCKVVKKNLGGEKTYSSKFVLYEKNSRNLDNKNGGKNA